ncbi:uncharacterized protein LOC131433072 [Malaya genurostris]|uniref:uncharacterized protein LOC131433072 n=1 Tax=Malaya genurostris TaxID=325434 RepID=UPI0026F3D8A4|nr:uncharacterized protein LOC131433072 [Malaya genurostris]
MICNCFQSTVIIGTLFFRNVNGHVANIVKLLSKFDANYAFWTQHPQKKFKICRQISAQINLLCYMHRVIDETVMRLINVFSLPMVMILLFQFTVLLSELYYDYMLVVTDLQAGRQLKYGQVVSSFLFVLMCGLQFFYTVSFAARMTRQAETTGLLLNELVRSDVGKFVDLSISVFTIEMLHHHYSVQLFGLFSVDFTLIYSVM